MRPWAAGIGFVLIGLAVTAAANTLALGDPRPVLQAFGAVGYALGLVAAGSGVHRVLWAHPTRRPGWARILISAAVTVPVFIAGALAIGLILTITHLRFG